MGKSTGFITRVYGSSYIYSIMGTLLVSITVNRLFSRRVKNLDMVSALKGVE
jgi:putative ABC transport system permease protein